MTWLARRRDAADLAVYLAAAAVGPAPWREVTAAAGVSRRRGFAALQRLERRGVLRGAWLSDAHGRVRCRVFSVRR